MDVWRSPDFEYDQRRLLEDSTRPDWCAGKRGGIEGVRSQSPFLMPFKRAVSSGSWKLSRQLVIDSMVGKRIQKL